jgi:hypothetical protein
MCAECPQFFIHLPILFFSTLYIIKKKGELFFVVLLPSFVESESKCCHHFSRHLASLSV